MESCRHSLDLRELKQCARRIHPGAEYEYERSLGVGVLDHTLHVEHGRLGELGSQVVDDEGGYTERHTISAQRPNNQHFLQLVARVVPFTCRRY